MSHSHHHHAHADAHATESWKPYAGVLAALLVLTIITVIAAGFDFGSANVAIALGIATIKATLVALFFMHLLHDKPINAVIAASGFLFLGLMLTFCLIDMDTREPLRPSTLKSEPKKPAAAAPAPAGEHAPAPAAEHH